MVSSFYSSNEKKQRDYIKDRKIKEENEFDQQERVDEALDKELGLERRATNIGLMSQRVAKKFSAITPDLISENILINAINNNQLSDLFEKIKLLEDKNLTKQQQSIRDNLKIKENKNAINDLIEEALPNGVDAIKEVILSLGDRNNILDLIKKANKINLEDYKTAIQTASAKREQKENEMMASEDINYALKPIPSKPATQAEIDAQNKAQANLDLIALFQQDVKEGRKRQALNDLKQLNADEDLRLRRNFMNVLEELKTNSAKNEKDKKLVKILEGLVENNRMYESYLEFSKLAIRDEFKKKIARNLEAMLFNKKMMENVKKLANTNRSNTALKEFNENLRTSTKGKRSGSDASTEVSSTFDKIDKRQFNTGAKKRDTNKDLEDFSNLLLKFELESGDKRKKIGQTIKNRISQQREINPKIADRMENLRQALLRR